MRTTLFILAMLFTVGLVAVAIKSFIGSPYMIGLCALIGLFAIQLILAQHEKPDDEGLKGEKEVTADNDDKAE